MFENLNLGNIGEMMSQMQAKAKEMESQSEAISYTAKSGGGLIKATVNGKSELIDLDIDDSLLEDRESLQILLISAINEAIKMAEDGKKQMAFKMMGDLGSLMKKD